MPQATAVRPGPSGTLNAVMVSTAAQAMINAMPVPKKCSRNAMMRSMTDTLAPGLFETTIWHGVPLRRLKHDDPDKRRR